METDIPCFQQIHFSRLHQSAHYKDGTYGLGDQRGDGSSLNPQIQSHYQQDIQKYIDKAAHDQIVQGTFGIPHCSQDRRPHIVNKYKDDAAEINAQIRRGTCHYIFRCVHQPQHEGGKNQPQHSDDDTSHNGQGCRCVERGI